MIEAEYEDEWELSPFEDVFLHRREQLDRLVGVTGAALRSMEGATRLSQSLKKSTEHVDSIRSLEEAALAEVAADMPLIHGSASVLLWGALGKH